MIQKSKIIEAESNKDEAKESANEKESDKEKEKVNKNAVLCEERETELKQAR